MVAPRLLSVGWIFGRIANLTFGGGDPTMAALGRELVEARGWLTRERFALAFSLGRITPGTNMLAFCAGAGWYLSGWRGALTAVLAAALPPGMLIVWFAYAYDSWKANPLAQGAIHGVLAAAVGMMLAGAWLLVRPRLKAGHRLRAIVLVAGAAILSLGFDVAPVKVLALTALAGYCWREKAEAP